MTLIGTYDISTLLAAKKTSVKEFGEVKVNEILQADLAAWNAMVRDMLSDLCEFSSDAMRWYGRSSNNDMVELDEYGRPPSVKVGAGYNIGFPLKNFGIAAGFTRKFLETATPADLAQRQLDVQKAHQRLIYTELQKALLRDGNLTVRDHLVDNVSLPVYRLINADGNPIPDGPFGETFTASTHNHYVSTGTAAVADYNNLIDNVVEHGHGSKLMLYINRADEATVSGYTGFSAHVHFGIDRSTIAASAGVSRGSLDETRMDDRSIGYLKGAEVFTKPWIPASYALCFAAGDVRKPLVFRQRSSEGLQGLRLAAEYDTYPLRAEVYEVEFGVGCWERTNGAVLYTGNDTWADGI